LQRRQKKSELIPQTLKERIVHLIMDLAAGFSKYELDEEIDKYGTEYFPGGTSVTDVVHWNELVTAKSFVARAQPQFSYLNVLADGANATITTLLSSLFTNEDGMVGVAKGGARAAWSGFWKMYSKLRAPAAPGRFRREDGSVKSRWFYLFAETNKNLFSESLIYNLQSPNIQAAKPKIYLFYGGYDALATPEGVKSLAGNEILNLAHRELRGLDLPLSQVVFFPTYDHVAFTWGTHIKDEVNECVKFAFEGNLDQTHLNQIAKIYLFVISKTIFFSTMVTHWIWTYMSLLRLLMMMTLKFAQLSI